MTVYNCNFRLAQAGLNSGLRNGAKLSICFGYVILYITSFEYPRAIADGHTTGAKVNAA